MINLLKRISLSKASKRACRTLWLKNGGCFDQASWTKISKAVKNEISIKLLATYGPKCIYCERYLFGVGMQIDHFAHKGTFPQFVFIAVNLYPSCTFCNSSSRKGQNSTISILDDNYKLCKFSILHPYFHNVSKEIIYTDQDKVFYDKKRCTQRGRDTISFFGWDDFMMTQIRARVLKNERDFPLTSLDEKRLIQECITYR